MKHLDVTTPNYIEISVEQADTMHKFGAQVWYMRVYIWRLLEEHARPMLMAGAKFYVVGEPLASPAASDPQEK